MRIVLGPMHIIMYLECCILYVLPTLYQYDEVNGIFSCHLYIDHPNFSIQDIHISLTHNLELHCTLIELSCLYCQAINFCDATISELGSIDKISGISLHLKVVECID